MRRSVYERELKPKFGNQKLIEITHEDLRALTDAIVERGAPATAVHAREVMLPLLCGVLSSLLTRPFCAVPRTSVSRIA